MDVMDIFAMQDEFSLHEAASLILGNEPTPYDQSRYRDSAGAYKSMARQLREAVFNQTLTCSSVMINYPAPVEDRPTYVDEFGNEKTEMVLFQRETPQSELSGSSGINPDFTKVGRKALFDWLEARQASGPFIEALRRQESPSLQQQLDELAQKLAQTEQELDVERARNRELAAQLSKVEQTLAEEKALLAENEQRFMARLSTADKSYSDPSSEHYAPKLAAAVAAHAHIANYPESTRGRSVKQAIGRYIDENAKQLGLLDQNGELSKSTREAICLVSNTNTKGGTPSY